MAQFFLFAIGILAVNSLLFVGTAVVLRAIRRWYRARKGHGDGEAGPQSAKRDISPLDSILRRQQIELMRQFVLREKSAYFMRSSEWVPFEPRTQKHVWADEVLTLRARHSVAFPVNSEIIEARRLRFAPSREILIGEARAANEVTQTYTIQTRPDDFEARKATNEAMIAVAKRFKFTLRRDSRSGDRERAEVKHA